MLVFDKGNFMKKTVYEYIWMKVMGSLQLAIIVSSKKLQKLNGLYA